MILKTIWTLKNFYNVIVYFKDFFEARSFFYFLIYKSVGKPAFLVLLVALHCICVHYTLS